MLSARAGTPLAEIEALLEENNQELAFEPIDYGPLLGGEASRGTLGGAIAANLSGPRRISPAPHAIISWASPRLRAAEKRSSPAGAW